MNITTNVMTGDVLTGDVVEVDVEGLSVTALVLLATPEAVILDACDGSTPFVVRQEELRGHVRVFDGLAAASEAAAAPSAISAAITSPEIASAG